MEEGRGADAQVTGGELVFRNDQPFDHLTNKRNPLFLTPSSFHQPPRFAYGTTGYEQQWEQTRDERSLGAQSGSSFRDTSLAMRALNLNRLMQHLASGGQPLMSYEKLFSQDRAGQAVQSGEPAKQQD